jgi:hypothetical protein
MAFLKIRFGCKPGIVATGKVEIRRITVKGQPQQKVQSIKVGCGVVHPSPQLSGKHKLEDHS